MKQFMTISAFFLSAACVCVNSPSFASSAANQVTQGTNDVVQGTVKGTENVVKGVGQAAKDGVDAIGKGTQDLIDSAK